MTVWIKVASVAMGRVIHINIKFANLREKKKDQNSEMMNTHVNHGCRVFSSSSSKKQFDPEIGALCTRVYI